MLLKRPALSAVLSLFVFASCHSDNPVVPEPHQPSVQEDAALSIAQAISLNAGGLLDQIGDIADITSTVYSPSAPVLSIQKSTLDSVNTTFTRSYDTVSGWWSLSLE